MSAGAQMDLGTALNLEAHRLLELARSQAEAAAALTAETERVCTGEYAMPLWIWHPLAPGETGLSAERLAALCGCTRHTVQRMVNDGRLPILDPGRANALRQFPPAAVGVLRTAMAAVGQDG